MFWYWTGSTSLPRVILKSMRILLATTNRGKIRELKQILGQEGLEVIGLDKHVTTEELEVGSTFAENALLKARHYHLATGFVTISDDSGLEVDALGGAPGIASARYAGPEASDHDRINKLLGALENAGEGERGARFVCAAAIRWSSGERVFEDEARGRILREPRGDGGFGYDPVFYYPPLDRTFAQLSEEVKAKVSHRGLAFRRLADWLKQSALLDTLKRSEK